MKIRQSPIKFFLLIFLTAGLTLAPSLQAEDPVVVLPLPNPQAIYVLSEHLSEANTVILIENKESRKGVWENDHFSFYGLNKDGNVQVINESANNQNWQSIQMNALQGSDRMIQFGNVPSGSGMIFYYKTTLDKPSKQNVYIYVVIKAGKKDMARFRVTANQEGWQRISIPLGILRLFSRTFPLTVTVLGDKKHQPAFNFYSEIYQ